MNAPLRKGENPYPPEPPDEPDWFSAIWHMVSRVSLFGVGAVLVFLPHGSDVQITAGSALMLGSAGIAVARGFGK